MDGSVTVRRCGRLVPAMTRCECAEITFDDLARRMREQRASLDAVQAETGAGLMCTACLPDLREHLAAAGAAVPAPSDSSCVPAGVLAADLADHDEEAAAPPSLAEARDPR
jgi:bacterioferritin-associated ferredoxin